MSKILRANIPNRREAKYKKNMKYYDSTMSMNMGKNILATTATITLKEAIPKFKGAISHGHPSSSNDEKTARTKSLSSHKDE